jgi:hypothetical protein
MRQCQAELPGRTTLLKAYNIAKSHTKEKAGNQPTCMQSHPFLSRYESVTISLTSGDTGETNDTNTNAVVVVFLPSMLLSSNHKA